MFDQLITERVHDVIKPWIPEGGIAIDGTMGNGHDTEFLATTVGKDGSVYAFDIQPAAIQETYKTLLTSYGGLSHRPSSIKDVQEIPGVHLICANHARIKELKLSQGIDVALFNLGYLPGGDKTITTFVESTMEALLYIVEHLNIKGILSIVTYPGHEMGAIEDKTISQWLGQLSKKRFEVLQLAYMNRQAAPKHYMIYRLR